MRKVEYIVLEYNELNEMVHNNFPTKKDWDFVEEEEGYNYWCKTFNDIDAGDELAKQEFEWWLEGKDSLLKRGVFTIEILQALVRKGILESGNYLIKIFW